MDPSIDNWLATTGIQPQLLDQPIENDIHLANIAKSLLDWNAAIPFLGLTKVDEEDIEVNNRTQSTRRFVL